MAEGPLPPGLGEALASLAGCERVLVALDFDGVLAPLVDDPEASRPVAGAMEVALALSALPGTTVALVSGRDLATLDRLSGATDPLVRVGSHGAEPTWRDGVPLTADQQALLETLDSELAAVAAAHPDARLEVKPTSRVVHTRGLDAAVSGPALDSAAEVARRHPGVHTTPGKDVFEMAVVEGGKGPAITDLARDRSADGVLYAGDDVTDERAFEHLASQEGLRVVVRVKVGDGPTAAEHRLGDEAAVVGMLGDLLRLREHAGR